MLSGMGGKDHVREEGARGQHVSEAQLEHTRAPKAPRHLASQGKGETPINAAAG